MEQRVSYTAGQVEPFWQLFINERWVEVRAAIETEKPSDGTHYVTFMFDEDTELPAVKLRKDAVVKARPPELPLDGEQGP